MTNRQEILQFANKYFVASSGKVIKYLISRGITKESIDKFKIGYDDGYLRYLLSEPYFNPKVIKELSLINEGGYDYFHNRITFPIFSGIANNNHIYGFIGRTFINGEPKYLRSKNLSGVVYNMPSLKSNILAITEGPLDVLLLEQIGIKSIALMGVSIPKELPKILNKKDEILLMLDSDRAGIIAAKRIKEKIPKATIVKFPIGYDPNSFICNFGKYQLYKLIKVCKELKI